MKPGDALGRFVVVRRLGAGAMGTVYEARDPELARSVAIKLVGEPESQLERRLQREAQALAQLQHPNVVAVYELGAHAGQLFVAMELVDGVDLAGHLALDDRTWREIVKLFIDAGRGLAAVHAKGIVHRDIKPSNLLVDSTGRVRVGDFGLARLVGEGGEVVTTEPPIDEVMATASTVNGWAPGGGSTTIDSITDVMPRPQPAASPGPDALATPLTRAGAIIGTPYYMAPEQLKGRRVSPATDQFSFCIAMWVALFQTHPFGDPVPAASDRPTKFLGDVGPAVLAGKRRPTVTRGVPRWLVRVLDRGLSVDPALRFGSMTDLVHELERGISKRKPIAIAIAAAALVIAGFTAWSITSANRRAERDDTEQTARVDAATLARATVALDLDPAKSLALVSTLSPGSSSWRAARMVISDARERGVSRTIETHGHARALALSADGTLVAALVDKAIHVWDANTLVERWSMPVDPQDVAAVGFAPEALVVASFEGMIYRRDLATGVIRSQRAVAGEFNRAVIAPGGRYVLLLPIGSPTVLVDLDRSERTLATYFNAAWSPDGRIAALYDRHDGHIDRLDVATGETAPWVPKERLREVVIGLATDGARVWIGGWKGRVAEVGKDFVEPRVTDHAGPMTTLEGMTDGRLLAACETFGFEGGADDDIGAADDTLTISDDNTAHVAHLRGHKAEIESIAIAGDLIASTDRAGEIRLWRRSPTVMVAKPRTTAGAAIGDDTTLIVARRGPILDVVDTTTRQVEHLYITSGPPGYEPPEAALAGRPITIGDRRIAELYERGDGAVTAIARSTSGRIVATLDSKHQVVVWDLDARSGRMLVDHVTRMALASDGSRVITAGEDGALHRWTLVNHTSDGLGKVAAAPAVPAALACSTDCSTVAVVANGTVWLTDTNVKLDSPDDHLLAAAVSPDDLTVVAGGDGRELHVWSVATKTRRSLIGATASITRVAFLPDGRVAAAARDGSIQLWQLADGSETTLRGHTAEIRSIVMRGDTLVTTSADRTARIWDLATGTSRTLAGPDQFATPTRDGRVAAVDTFDTTYWFTDDLPTDEGGLRSWLATFVSARSAQGSGATR